MGQNAETGDEQLSSVVTRTLLSKIIVKSIRKHLDAGEQEELCLLKDALESFLKGDGVARNSGPYAPKDPGRSLPDVPQGTVTRKEWVAPTTITASSQIRNQGLDRAAKRASGRPQANLARTATQYMKQLGLNGSVDDVIGVYDKDSTSPSAGENSIAIHGDMHPDDAKAVGALLGMHHRQHECYVFHGTEHPTGMKAVHVQLGQSLPVHHIDEIRRHFGIGGMSVAKDGSSVMFLSFHPDDEHKIRQAEEALARWDHSAESSHSHVNMDAVGRSPEEGERDSDARRLAHQEHQKYFNQWLQGRGNKTGAGGVE